MKKYNNSSVKEIKKLGKKISKNSQIGKSTIRTMIVVVAILIFCLAKIGKTIELRFREDVIFKVYN